MRHTPLPRPFEREMGSFALQKTADMALRANCKRPVVRLAAPKIGDNLRHRFNTFLIPSHYRLWAKRPIRGRRVREAFSRWYKTCSTGVPAPSRTRAASV